MMVGFCAFVPTQPFIHLYLSHSGAIPLAHPMPPLSDFHPPPHSKPNVRLKANALSKCTPRIYNTRCNSPRHLLTRIRCSRWVLQVVPPSKACRWTSRHG
jgi:hypothetical protein